MTTISVPLDSALTDTLNKLVSNLGASRAAVMRKALERLAEEEAINAVLLAQKEPTLRGDLGELLKKMD